ncbi:hypothetical protein K2173_007307 [Erythroxylum novogranatense]|uniref:EF-hand domain-containing protein n=1 Tax=Erythroxylum novogranatense TaxID=1862640 RepID=A0AAV8T725_9ROSI|nr:hypothetical protein K2173_007307 [Erythroxylum novogranatense]
MSTSFLCTRGIDKSNPMTRGAKSDLKSVSVQYTERQLRDTFKRYDTNRDGRLSKQELMNAFASLGSHLPCWRAWRALQHADANGDGCIGEDEFGDLIKYVRKRAYTIK